MPNIIGTGPNQVPTNADLGTMAFQDSKSVNVTDITFTGSTKLMTSSGGGVIIQPSGNTATDVTVKVPTQNCTLGIQGPAFSAYASTGTSVGASTWTKVTFDTKSFDTNNTFASSRFTPTVAGYYDISACIGLSSTSAQNCWIAVYKNGNAWQYGSLMTQNAGTGGLNNMASLVYCNGTTDYIEIYGLSSTAQTLATGSQFTYFSGALVRAA